MKEPKDYLNIDLEFLNKKEPVRVVSPKPESPKVGDHGSKKAKTDSNSSKKYNWKSIFIIGGIILFFGWAIFSDSDSSSTPLSNSYAPSTQTSNKNINNDTVVRGDYNCSNYNAGQVDKLAPTESELSITIAQNSLERQNTYLDNLQSEIDNSFVNDYSSQYEINEYNEKVDDYNTKLASYKRDVANFSSRIDTFNAQVQAHNNYLMNHCTKAY